MKCRLNGSGRAFTAAVFCVAVFGVAAGSRCDETNRIGASDSRVSVDRSIGILWSDSPLRTALENLARQQEVFIWLDRRVDPGRPVSATAQDTPIREFLADVARREGLGLCVFGSVLYLGPSDSVATLRTLGELRRQDARVLPRAKSRRFLREEPMQWDDLAAPRDLLARLGEENQVEIVDLDRVVHDLWPAMRLPSLSLVDRLTLILAPFDLTFCVEDEGARIRLLPIPDQVFLTRRYPAGARREEVVERWKAASPESRIRIEGDEIVVEGRLEDHELLWGHGRPSRRVERARAAPGGKGTVERLRIDRLVFKDQPLEAIIRHLAGQFKLDLTLDADSLRRAGVDLDQRVSLEITNATVDELFEKLLGPVGLTFVRDDSTLEIRAAKPR
ncbi:MAG TPA: hypothetical protein DD670_12805 [Planctomycetaceae bacterium]|nr:hypothetical protein [Planctomycetaceae bacterium]